MRMQWFCPEFPHVTWPNDTIKNVATTSLYEFNVFRKDSMTTDTTIVGGSNFQVCVDCRL